MMHDGLAKRVFVPSLQCRKEADAVFGGIVGQLRIEDVRAGGEQIGEADELIAGSAGLDTAGPADDERNAMPALKNIRLGSAEMVARVVSLGGQFVELRLRRATVVTGENYQRVFGKTCPVERSQNLAETRIDLHHEIAVRIEPAFAL